MAADEDSVPEVPAPKSTSNKILPIILVVNTLLMTGVLVMVMKRPSAQASPAGKEHAAASTGSKDHDEPGKKGEGEGGEHGAAPAAEGPGPSLRLDAFIVQIRAAEGDRYAHMTIELEIASDADKPAFDRRMPRIRDGIIGYLADRNEDELRGSEGLGHVKEALVKKLDEIVPGHRVRGLYITEFIIQ